jgi:hypothetical protein
MKTNTQKHQPIDNNISGILESLTKHPENISATTPRTSSASVQLSSAPDWSIGELSRSRRRLERTCASTSEVHSTNRSQICRAQ